MPQNIKDYLDIAPTSVLTNRLNILHNELLTLGMQDLESMSKVEYSENAKLSANTFKWIQVIQNELAKRKANS